MAKKQASPKFKTFLFWILSLLGLVSAHLLLQGPVGLKDSDGVVTALGFKYPTQGTDGLLDIMSVKPTSLPVIALILILAGTLLAFAAHLFISSKKTNVLVVLGGLILLAGAVMIFFSVASFNGANESTLLFNPDSFALSTEGILGAVFGIVSGGGFAALEILL